MKKLIKFLLGSSIIKSIVLLVANDLIDEFLIWASKQIIKRLQGHPVKQAQAQTSIDILLSLNVQDFLKDEQTEKVITKSIDKNV